MAELIVVVALTSEMFFDVDDIPMIDDGVFRYWGAFADSPVPNYRVWVAFDRVPESQEEAEKAARLHFGTDEDDEPDDET